MATEFPIPTAGPSRLRRWLRRVIFGCVALSGLFAGWLWLDRWLEDRDWRAVCAEADRLDPGWRWADLMAARSDVPDGENSMLTVRAVCQFLPETWPDWPAAIRDDEIPPYVQPPPIPGIDEQPAPPTLEDRRYSHSRELEWNLDDAPPNQRLQPHQLTVLRRILAPAAPALAAVHPLTDQPHGRFPLDRNAPAIRSASQQDRTGIRRVQGLLRLHALHLAETDAGAAFSTIMPILNTAQLASDEPDSAGFLIAISARHIVRHILERSLGHGEPPVTMLAAVQRRIEEEMGRPIILAALRG